MSSKTLDEHIELTPGTVGGKPRIRGRRIAVQDVALWHARLGKTADEIAAEYDVTLADVHAALAYYFDHRDEIDRRIAEDNALVEALRRRIPSKLPHKLSSLRCEDRFVTDEHVPKAVAFSLYYWFWVPTLFLAAIVVAFAGSFVAAATSTVQVPIAASSNTRK